MNFKIFSLQEKVYLLITYGIVIISTILAIHYYLEIEDKSETFIISVMYALLLFVIGLYINTMQNKIQNLFYLRRDQYNSMKELKALFSSNKINSYSDNDMKSFIISHQVFTGRMENGDNKIPIKINQNGFSYEENFIDLEKKFIDQQLNILEIFNQRINEYIDDNKLIKKVNYIHFNSVFVLMDNISDWCENHLELTSAQRVAFLQYINRLLNELEKQINGLKKSIKKLRRKHIKYSRKISSNMCKIEKKYGDRLFNEISDTTLYHNFNVLEYLIRTLDNNITTNDKSAELQDSIQKLIVHSKELEIKIDQLTNIVNNIE